MTFQRTDSIILHELMVNQAYGETFLPHLKPEHFLDHIDRAFFEEISHHIDQYGQLPTEQAIKIAMDQRPEIRDDYERSVTYLETISRESKSDEPAEWLKDQTEQFIREKWQHNATLELILTMDGKGTKSVERCLEEIRQAHSFTLDNAPGLALEWEPLFEFLQSPDEKFPSQLDILNKMTCGGPSRKTLTLVVAPTNTGKSLILCHQAAEYVRQGRSVLYITLEMADKLVLKRIYANLLNTNMTDLEGWTKDQWKVANEGLGELGKLKVREYASRSAHAGNFRQYLQELKTKERFVPDVIIVDYLNECRSQNMKYGQTIGSYQYFGSICSELRALATDFNAVVWTATQTNRDGYDGDPDLKNTSESAQINSGADLIIGVNRDEKIPNALRFRVLKNRDAEHKDKVFIVGVDRGKMRLFDLADSHTEAERMNIKRAEIPKRNTRKPSFA